jgi:hypothetical protein
MYCIFFNIIRVRKEKSCTQTYPILNLCNFYNKIKPNLLITSVGGSGLQGRRVKALYAGRQQRYSTAKSNIGSVDVGSGSFHSEPIFLSLPTNHD